MIIMLRSKTFCSIIYSDQIVTTQKDIFIIIGNTKIHILHDMNFEALAGHIMNEKCVLEVDDSSGQYVLTGVSDCVRIDNRTSDSPKG